MTLSTLLLITINYYYLIITLYIIIIKIVGKVNNNNVKDTLYYRWKVDESLALSCKFRGLGVVGFEYFVSTKLYDQRIRG
jgi:hypothetical protein